ncbi:hypothetical protein [Nocardioides speluncae]|uniref:hypothetical protein n=1 Tax=Nocardioides speluncae TaxID=2670337 RepID=UPI0012B16ED3|nr:hypothetical protein [Nocardioides speluncae]
MLKRLLSAGAIVAVLAGGTGCVVDGQAQPHRPAGSFDQFLRADLSLIEKADIALLQRCLTEAGYPRPEGSAPPPTDLFDWLTDPPLQPRTVAQARELGFGGTIPAQPAQVLRSGRAYLTAVNRCERTARESLGDPAEVEDVRVRYVELGNRLGRELGQGVKAVLQAESDVLVPCLAGKGYSLPKGVRFDAQQNITQFGVTVGDNAPPVEKPVRILAKGVKLRPAVPARPYQPTTEERGLAVAFAQCGDSTGLFDRLDDRLPELRRVIAERHAEEFAELNPKIESIASRAEAVLAE